MRPQVAEMQRAKPLPQQTVVKKDIENFVPNLKRLQEADSKDLLFTYRNLNGDLVAFEERTDSEEGKEKRKKYHWWTPYDDGLWRQLEPEEGLPLYGLEKLREASSTVILCEGAKAARALRQDKGVSELLRKLTINHPWFGDMHACTFLGWAGGAPNPHRTDWGPLQKAIREFGVQRMIIVADNDEVGRQAVPEIAKRLRVETYTIQFTDQFPIGFDLADDFPSHMFATVETVIGEGPNDRKKVHQYVGPSFRSCLQPATWLTDEIPNPDGGLSQAISCGLPPVGFGFMSKTSKSSLAMMTLNCVTSRKPWEIFYGNLLTSIHCD